MHPIENPIRFQKCVVVFAGIPFAGKTTLGGKLASLSNIIFFDVDKTRWEVFPKPPKLLVLPDEEEHIQMMAAYIRNHEKARAVLSKDQPVALAATYSRLPYHEMVKDLAAENNAPLRFFLLSLSEEALAQRIIERPSQETLGTATTLEKVLEVQGRYQFITGVDVVPLNTSLPLDIGFRQVLESLSDLRID